MANKGSPFEREICKQLSLWWTNGRTDDVFWRTQGSGGRATNRSKRGRSTFGQYGDICAVNPIGLPLTNLFLLELKRGYHHSNIYELFDRDVRHKNSPKKQLQWEEWYDKANDNNEKAGTYSWLLIAKRDYRDTIVHMREDTLTLFQHAGAFQSNKYKGKILSARADIFTRPAKVWVRDTIVGIPLSDFLAEVSASMIVGMELSS